VSVPSTASGSWGGLTPVPPRRLTAGRRQAVQGLNFTYLLTEHLKWDYLGESPHVQDWQVSVEDGHERVASLHIIRADILTPDGYDLIDAVDMIDDIGGTLAAITGQVIGRFAEPSGDLFRNCRGGRGGTNILILESWKIDAAWDGYRLLDLIVATALDRLTNDTLFAVSEPAPIRMQGRERREFRQRFEPVLARLGFAKHGRGNVWINDFNTCTLTDELHRLQRRFSVDRHLPEDEDDSENDWLTPV